MKTQIVDMNVDPYAYRPFQLSAVLQASLKLVIPDTVTVGMVASLETLEYGSAPFKASVLMTQDPNDFDGFWAGVSRTFWMQIGGTPPPGTANIVVNPGETWFFNVTLAHDGKTGGGKGQVYSAAGYFRSFQ